MSFVDLNSLQRSERSYGRNGLAPFTWFLATMFMASHFAAQGASDLPVLETHAQVDDEIIAQSDDLIAPLAPEADMADTAVLEVEPPLEGTKPDPVEEMAVRPRPIQKGAAFVDLRRPLDLNFWRLSTHKNDEAHAFYGGPWLPENIVQTPDRLILKVMKGRDGAPPTMAEMQSRQKYGYGRYEVIMRPSTESGIVSTFFTYTGPWSGDPQDEIDIEFIGKRPKSVEYNYWKSGKTGAHSREPLAFDISDRMNLYAFEWHEDEIIWFVNGEEHYRSPRDRSKVPSHPGNIFISAWTGVPRMADWTGRPKFGESAQAEYACVSYTPFEDDSYSCADLFAEDPQFQGQRETITAMLGH